MEYNIINKYSLRVFKTKKNYYSIYEFFLFEMKQLFMYTYIPMFHVLNHENVFYSDFFKFRLKTENMC